MDSDERVDESLVRRLPLPLAQLYRRAHNAKMFLEQHQTAFFLWEAGLKLLASAAVVEYAVLAPSDPQTAVFLRHLRRPALGHWWGFARKLVPRLADAGDTQTSWRSVSEILMGRARDDLPRAAALYAALREVLDGQPSARATVRVADLFDQLIRYRNAEIGHGGREARTFDYYRRMGPLLLAGAAEVFDRLDVLSGRRLVYVAALGRNDSGVWCSEQYELLGETARRLPSQECFDADVTGQPIPGQLYLFPLATEGAVGATNLHSLVRYDAETGQVFFFNSQGRRQRAEYLCYASGQDIEVDDVDLRDLLARICGEPVGTIAADTPLPMSPDEQATRDEVPARRSIGDFELISELGRGGMGVVYRAMQPTLGRQVALKVLYQTGNPAAEARFAREIRALGRVEHPNLVKVAVYFPTASRASVVTFRRGVWAVF
jgi:Protein kinase domain